MTPQILARLGQQYGTPLYIYDADAFARRVSLVADALGEKTRLCYSIKANSFLLACLPPEIEILEVCSPGELEICRDLRIPPEQILFSGVNKTAASVEAAMEYGVGVYTAESVGQTDLLHSLAAQRKKKIPVLLRLTAGDQFGMDEEDLKHLIARRGEYPCLDFVGIHYFSGTQKTKAKKIIRELEYLTNLAEDLKARYGFAAERLEYGTGLFADYFGADPDKAEEALLQEAAPALRAASERFRLTVEMGRFLAAPCGTYLTAVRDLKVNQGIRYAILDGGGHQLHYDGQLLGMRQPPVTVLSEGGELLPYTLCGSLCSVGDKLAQDLTLPKLSEGSILAFHRVGAYSAMEGTALFLSRDIPPVVLRSEKDGDRLLRKKAETWQFNGPLGHG